MLEPFAYSYMTNAMWVASLVGGVCGFLSAYLMLIALLSFVFGRLSDRLPRWRLIGVGFLVAAVGFFAAGVSAALALFVAALLFAVHPIHTEAVTYIAGRSDPLSAFFMLAALLWFARDPRPGLSGEPEGIHSA